MSLVLKVGCDPELFVKRDNEFVSGHGLIKGTKLEPFPVDNGAVQVDGMALEFNIDPATEADEFVYNIDSVMSQLRGLVPPEYSIVTEQVAVFSSAILNSQPDEALELGCDPDFNAWRGVANEGPTPGDFRTAAGHVHVGWTDSCPVTLSSPHGTEAMGVVRQLDYYLGLPSLLYDSNQKRRELYGRAGAMRVKPYGVEYRVLSNAWLRSEKLIRAVYTNTISAIEAIVRGDILAERFGNAAEDVINSGDVNGAVELLNKTGVDYEAFL